MRPSTARLHRDESGLAGTVLVIVIAWALAAVFLLTRTLVAAHQIDERVAFITTQTDPIAEDVDLVRLADDTADIAEEIADGVAPLDDQLGEVVATADDVEGTSTSILATARAIERSAGRIEDHGGSIARTATSIDATAADIEGTAAAIRDIAEGIEAEAGSIGGRFATLVTTVESIACGSGEANRTDRTTTLAEQRARCGADGVPGIVNRAQIVVRLADRIEADTDDIVVQVGPGHRVDGRTTLHGHANSIDCQLDGAHCGQ